MRYFPSSLLVVFAVGVVLGGVRGANGAPPQNPAQRLEELKRQAGAESAAERREAARGISKFPRYALPTLLKLLQDRDAGVRLAAVEGVGSVVGGSRAMTVYGPTGRGLALVPVYSGRGPLWTGEPYQKLLGDHAAELKARLEKLQKDDARSREAAGRALHQLNVRLAAARVSLKEGRGKALTQDPKDRAKVEGGELKDARGKVLAKLTGRGPESVACWAFSPDGRLLAVGIRYDSSKGGAKDYTIRGYLRVYDPATGDRVGEAGSAFGPVTTLAFSRDGKVLLYQTGEYKEVGGK